jgi:signal transduction histidine kinase
VVSRSEDGLERIKAHLLALSEALPALIERLRERAAAEGRNDLLERPPTDPDEVRERLASFAAYLDHFGRFDAHILGPIDVRAVLEDAVALTRGEIASKGQLTASYLSAPLVYANPRHLGHVFVSLLVNAAQALPDGDRGGNAVAVELDTTEAGWARVAIADTGVGIHPDVLPLIFEPLFSTKRGAGTGIGLAIVREIVRGLGGRLSVESALGGGTMFILELPPVP